MEEITNFCKEYGFIFPGSQIYGGLANSWDYGPLGVQLKKNIADLWWKKFVQEQIYNVPLDSSILLNSDVWKASGHVGGFSDPLMDCKACKTRHRADHLIEDNSDELPGGWSNEKMKQFIDDEGIACPNCGAKDFSDIKEFQLMFKTQQGVIANEGNDLYLRPETAQGIFINFKNVLRSTRRKLPMGIAQIGKAFRNEITPGNMTFRTREFEQMELEFFCKPGTDMEWFNYWKEYCYNFLLDLGINKDNLLFRNHEGDELSHYSSATVDIEYVYPFGASELWGIANRTTYDLTAHMEASKQSMEYHDPETNEKYIPYVIEPSLGLGRAVLAFICDAYHIDEERGLIFKIHPALAPIQICVLPLQKQQAQQAQELYQELAKHFLVEYEGSGNIGKRYKRQDAIGTPYCITVDFDTADDNSVTIRNRDTMEQERINIDDLNNYFAGKFEY